MQLTLKQAVIVPHVPVESIATGLEDLPRLGTVTQGSTAKKLHMLHHLLTEELEVCVLQVVIVQLVLQPQLHARLEHLATLPGLKIAVHVRRARQDIIAQEVTHRLRLGRVIADIIVMEVLARPHNGLICPDIILLPGAQISCRAHLERINHKVVVQAVSLV